jgi:glycosyltransferase involved in cell wall biosynthesis
MGASDPGGLTLPAVEGLGMARRRKGGLVARVLANPVAPVWMRLGPALRRLDFPPACAVDPTGMVDQLAGADVAVLAMGVTVYEAMACGVPAIVVGRTSGDVAHMRTLEQQGAILSLGLHWTEERVAAAVDEVLSTPGRLEAMGAAGRTLVDGQGAGRVARRLAALISPRKGVDAGQRVDA